MKKISLLMIALGIASMTMAKSIVFTLSNGTEVYYLLGGETNPKMAFENGKVIVNTDEYELSNIKSFRISDKDDPTGIEHTIDRNKVEYSNGMFLIKGNANAVTVYGLDGAQVPAAVSSADGFICVDLKQQPSGVYIINVKGTSFKVMKK